MQLLKSGVVKLSKKDAKKASILAVALKAQAEIAQKRAKERIFSAYALDDLALWCIVLDHYDLDLRYAAGSVSNSYAWRAETSVLTRLGGKWTVTRGIAGKRDGWIGYSNISNDAGKQIWDSIKKIELPLNWHRQNNLVLA